MKLKAKLTIFFLYALLLVPEAAFASGIDEFQGPIEKVLGTITGPVGGLISAIAFGISGFALITKRAELSDTFIKLLTTIVGITFIAFCGTIVNAIFSFSGATL
ncbi:TrbC/VirB2 family protein [Desulfovibrio sp. JC010]|uniref:TrbC/VirB2 family protein n=1 Tax=Desulfovibrio sp. JC010 TaxID=2593641 RepID=UPI0013D0ECB0|nr:TrbC/VirB2 family protein [Desulfovibrio sp. JC010]NDV26928.1 TrbC/VirB2 family protein [Desulfovibrio sp. JC010]